MFRNKCWYLNAKVWSRYEEPKEEVVQENEVLERKISYKTVVVTEVTPEMHFYAQNTETGELLWPDLYVLKHRDQQITVIDPYVIMLHTSTVPDLPV